MYIGHPLHELQVTHACSPVITSAVDPKRNYLSNVPSLRFAIAHEAPMTRLPLTAAYGPAARSPTRRKPCERRTHG